MKYLVPLLALLLAGCPAAGMGPVLEGGAGGTPVGGPTPPPAPLAPPPAGQGVQLQVGPFAVPEGTEVQKNFYMKLPTTEDVWVSRIQIRYPAGSHHCNLFKSDALDVPDHVEDTFDAVAYESYDMFAASQRGELDWQLPAGVAIPLKRAQQLLVQTHFVNGITQRTTDAQVGVKVNLWFAPAGSKPAPLGMLFAIDKTIDIPPNATHEQRKRVDLRKLGLAQDVKILGMTGHFHGRGRTFEVRRDDAAGERLYRSESWDDPPFMQYDPPVALPAGSVLSYATTFVNPTGFTIRFGPKVETQEHSNLFMYFYPGPPSGKAVYDVDGLP